MEQVVTQFIEALLLPPGLILSLLLAGVLLRQRFYRTGQWFMYAGVACLLLFSLPLVTTSLIQRYEDLPPLDATALKQTAAGAIVLLGGGRYDDAPEYQADTVSRHALERARYAAYLQQQTGLPILVSGGNVYRAANVPEGELLKQVLEQAFSARVRWVEGQSRTTYENAQYSRELLAREDIQHVLLVTHALHMPRSVEAFEQAGLTVTAAPMGYHTAAKKPLVLRLLPDAVALRDARILMHELLGRVWYHVRYYF